MHGGVAGCKATGKADTLQRRLARSQRAEDALLVIDQVRFEEAFTGDAILVNRSYDVSDENQPSALGLSPR